MPDTDANKTDEDLISRGIDVFAYHIKLAGKLSRHILSGKKIDARARAAAHELLRLAKALEEAETNAILEHLHQHEHEPVE